MGLTLIKIQLSGIFPWEPRTLHSICTSWNILYDAQNVQGISWVYGIKVSQFLWTITQDLVLRISTWYSNSSKHIAEAYSPGGTAAPPPQLLKVVNIPKGKAPMPKWNWNPPPSPNPKPGIKPFWGSGSVRWPGGRGGSLSLKGNKYKLQKWSTNFCTQYEIHLMLLIFTLDPAGFQSLVHREESPYLWKWLPCTQGRFDCLALSPATGVGRASLKGKIWKLKVYSLSIFSIKEEKGY